MLPGADLDKAVSAAVTGRFCNAGQVCMSSKRMIVESSVFDESVDRFVSKASEWQVGDPTNEGTRLGPMASLLARNHLADQVEDAVAKGAVVHLGGEVLEGPGLLLPGHGAHWCDSADACLREELFGPVAVLYQVDSVDDAITLANDSPFGLGGAVFTDDLDQADDVANRLDVGMVGPNTTVKSAPDLPFGGVKNSGIGRELGRFGLDEFANKKLVRIL